MRRLLDLGLERLSGLLLQMAELSRSTVELAVQAYRDPNKVREVNERSRQLRELHEQVGELAMELIMRYEPVASDLRFIRASMEISYGFYRFGRYAHDIAEVVEMFGDLSDCDYSKVLKAATISREMIRLSVEAFLRRDAEAANRVRSMDDQVDGIYREHIREMLSRPPERFRCLMSQTLILRYLERIADHAVHIADSVVYIVSGSFPG
jgi:phosphate transport system protein